MTKSFFEHVTHKGPNALLQLLPGIFYFAKDSDKKFVAASQNLIEFLGFHNQSELIGKTDFDLFDFDIAEKYRLDDEKVLSLGESITNRVELLEHADGHTQWVITNKVPLYFKDKIGGLEGVVRVIDSSEVHTEPCVVLRKAVEAIQERYMEDLSIKELAQISNMSLSALERNFKRYFNMTPSKYIRQFRIRKSCDLLKNVDAQISEVATKVGFCDQSYFTKEFRKALGMTPFKYRKKYHLNLQV